MENQNLPEEVLEEIRIINQEIKTLHDKVKSDYEELLKELEYRRSLGEDI